MASRLSSFKVADVAPIRSGATAPAYRRPPPSPSRRCALRRPSFQAGSQGFGSCRLLFDAGHLLLVAASGDARAHWAMWTIIAAMAFGPRIKNQSLAEIVAA
ncbi:hypothetical protein [Amycolatopsis thermophila]|uniref:Uncharacterized protein n=1 Tax=Amycolatopsis thermophila TaxID=206084 RepID=A0ABU0F5B5_9PSEU|nr:hypothetical protein [Amycolatopsis thermophila]MDQ0382786.1 hypothetical protein [Amycolatopsis thermophila]